MKNIFLLLICMLVCCAAAFAQSVTLTFTAKDAANHYVQLNRVVITNLTKSWQETIYWPDTTLTMQNGTGIHDVETFPETSLKLSQNNPNPFTGTTEVSLMVAEDDEVMLDIADVNGKIVGTHRMRPQAGVHQFRIILSTAGTYIMTARQNGQTSSIKMVCNGGGDGNRIEYTGNDGNASLASATQPKNGPKYTTTRPFNFGDQMEYVGYATINGSEVESQRITQMQGASQTFTLQFTQTQHQLPAVTTSAVSNITSSSATAGGTVTSDGGATVFDRGVCYSTASMPTVSDNCIHIGQGTGTFSGNITGLNDNTTYYVRAYAMSSAGVAYGNEVSFTTTSTSAITVTTDPVTNIGSHTVTCGGTVIYDGEENVMVRGVCWNTSPNPTANHSHTTDGSGVGHFTSQLTGLNPGTTYYVRAYATNSIGTAYGNEVTFTTLVTLPTVTTASISNITTNAVTCGGNVTDDGGATVIARGVCWSTLQNPIVSGNHTTNGSGTGSFTSEITGLSAVTTYYVRAYAINSVDTAYGDQLYFTTPGPCPGVATVTDIDNNTYQTVQIGNQCWMKENLRTTRYANGENIPNLYAPDNNNSNVSTYGYLYSWSAVMHGATSTSSNPSGVQGVCPNGWHVPSRAEWTQLTDYVSSQTQYQCDNSSNNIAKALASTTGWNSSTETCAVGNNPSMNNATGFSALPAGSYCSDYDNFDSSAVFWSTTGGGYSILAFNYPLHYESAGVGGYSYSSMSCGLSVRCVKEVGSEDTDGQPCLGAATITDIDNNTYNTVQIGNQCWMKENLRTTHYSNGTSIALGSSTSTTTAYRYYPDNNSSNVNTYGYLYNWKAVKGSSSSSSADSSDVQRICPTGWHVPSDWEWTQLTNYVNSQIQYQCNNIQYNIAKALTSTTGWSSSIETCAVGNNPSTNNATGFSALPAGYYLGDYNYFGYDAIFWSATDYNTYFAYYRTFDYSNANVHRDGYIIESGFSVRCVRD